MLIYRHLKITIGLLSKMLAKIELYNSADGHALFQLKALLPLAPGNFSPSRAKGRFPGLGFCRPGRLKAVLGEICSSRGKY